MKLTDIIAHMAGPLDAPENTTAAMSIAKQLNPELSWVELDLRWNKSNFPFLLHDTTLDRTTNLTGSMADYWFGDLMLCDAADFSPWNKKVNGVWQYPQYHGIVSNGSGAQHSKCHPPYGGEFFECAQSLDLNLLLDVRDVPTQAQAEKLYNYITSYNYKSKCIYMSSLASVTAMKTFYPDLDYMVIEYPPANMTREAESMKKVGIQGYCIPINRLTKEKVEYYKSSNLKIFTWSSDTPAIDVQANWQKAMSWGVDGLITNQHLAAQQLT